MVKRYKKRLGQHFLHDSNVINKIIDVIRPSKKDIFLEIGPGEGALTNSLYNVIEKIYLIEKDKDLIPFLKHQYDNTKKIHIINADILKYDLSKLMKSQFRIIGNLPYNISTEIIFRVITMAPKIKDIHFMLQKEVIERIVSTPGSKIYGRLSVMTQLYFNVKKLFNISANVFIPKPKVDSAYIRLLPRKTRFLNQNHEISFKRIVTIAFTARRKMIKTSLKKFIDEDTLKSLSIDPKSRPETLSVDNFMDISKNVK